MQLLSLISILIFSSLLIVSARPHPPTGPAQSANSHQDSIKTTLDVIKAYIITDAQWQNLLTGIVDSKSITLLRALGNSMKGEVGAHGGPALCHAVSTGNLEAVTILLDAGVDVNYRS